MLVTTLTLFSQILTSALSIFFLKHFKTKFYIILVIIFCLTAFTEALGKYLTSINILNYHLYVFYAFFTFNLTAIAYESILKLTKFIVFLSLIFNIVFFIVFFRDMHFFYSVIVGSFNTGIYSFLYLRQLLLSKEIINYKKHFAFWVSVGFLIFYLPSIPFFLLNKFMQNRSLFKILNFLTILMNFLIIYGLITCRNKKLKY